MTFSELNIKLRQLTTQEIENKKNKDLLQIPLIDTKQETDLFLDEDTIMPPGEHIVFTTHPRFSTVATHRHSFIELIYVYSGCCQQTINDKKITMVAGEVCILDTNVKHAITTVGEDDIVINCLMRKSYFDVSFLSRLSGNDLLSRFFVHAIFQSKDYNNYILFPSKNQENLQHNMKSVLCEYYDPGLCSKEMISSYMILLFSELLRTYKKAFPRNPSTTSDKAQITDILVYLQTHYHTATLSSTAQYFNFNASYLSRLIKQTTGKSFMQIIHAARLKRVCLLLETTDIPIENLIHEVGYSNINYFYQLFRKHENLTPYAYREKFRI